LHHKIEASSAMKFLHAISLAGLITGISASCIEAGRLHRRAEGEFSYHGLTGALHWYALNPSANQLCAKGTEQTPINVKSNLETVSGGNRPNPAYGVVSNVEFRNLRTTLQAFLGNQKLTYGGVEYTVLQFHFHTPSEHHVQDEHYPLEVHFVHQRTEPLPDGSKPLAVYGILFDITTKGRGSKFFSEVLARAPQIASSGQSTTFSSLNFTEVEQHIRNTDAWTYSGSLTTPPCSQGVRWLLSKTPMLLDPEEYTAAKKVMKFNSRYVQNDLGQTNLLQDACSKLN
jgi:carbonic anhydrase